MQNINFGSLNFSSIPQMEQQARQQQYAARKGVWDAIGSGAAGIGRAYDDMTQKRLADEWRTKQWQYQKNRDKILDARYDAEQQRLAEERRQSQEAAQQLQSQFIDAYGDTDLSRYGIPAQFAMARIKNARTWDDVVGGGSSLAQAIQYRDTLDAQNDERMRSQQEAYIQGLGPKLDQRIGSEMATSGMDVDKIDDIYATTPKTMRDSRLNQLKAWRDQLVEFGSQYPLTPDMQRRLNSINGAIRAWQRKMRYRPVQF